MAPIDCAPTNMQNWPFLSQSKSCWCRNELSDRICVLNEHKWKREKISEESKQYKKHKLPSSKIRHTTDCYPSHTKVSKLSFYLLVCLFIGIEGTECCNLISLKKRWIIIWAPSLSTTTLSWWVGRVSKRCHWICLISYS